MSVSQPEVREGRDLLQDDSKLILRHGQGREAAVPGVESEHESVGERELLPTCCVAVFWDTTSST